MKKTNDSSHFHGIRKSATSVKVDLFRAPKVVLTVRAGHQEGVGRVLFQIQQRETPGKSFKTQFTTNQSQKWEDICCPRFNIEELMGHIVFTINQCRHQTKFATFFYLHRKLVMMVTLPQRRGKFLGKVLASSIWNDSHSIQDYKEAKSQRKETYEVVRKRRRKTNEVVRK